MSTYSPSEPTYQQSPVQTTFLPQYAETPDSNGPRAPVPPGFYPHQDPNLQPMTPQNGVAAKPDGEHGRTGNRLRKACDNCSIRKVKCDEHGPPCKACVALEIPCTFDRPSKRRGPPNRLAENLKRQKVENSSSPIVYPMSSSPTNAAQTLAAISSQPRMQTLESICPLPLLRQLIDDFFTYIHPVIPIPHESSYRSALESPENHSNASFLAMTASMVSCLTASFARRPLHHLKQHNLEHMFESSRGLIEKCQTIAENARGVSRYDRSYTVYEAIISYLQGVTNVYTWKKYPAILYFKESISIISILGHNWQGPSKRAPNGVAGQMAANGESTASPEMSYQNVEEYEMARRVFWLAFASVRTLQQLGVPPSQLGLPLSTKPDPWPIYPNEVDDEYIFPETIREDLQDRIPEMLGFNINSNLFASYDVVSAREARYGVDELVDWEAQKNELQDSLKRVQEILSTLPSCFQLPSEPNRMGLNASTLSYPDPDAARSVDKRVDMETPTREARHAMMLNIQRANIHATQLRTRSYLVEKYFTLNDKREHPSTHQSPTSIAPSLPRDADSLEAFMSNEFKDIISSLLRMLSTIESFHMEPNGASLVSKIRSIAITLMSNTSRPASLLPRQKVDEYLKILTFSLSKIQKTVYAEQNPHDEDEVLRKWADLRDAQNQFVAAGGFSGP